MTVQQTLEHTIEAITQQEALILGSGRTDAGAHALGQVVVFDTASSLSASTLQRAMNALLPFDISITAADDVAGDYHPRLDAESRVYRYLIWNRPVRSPFWHGRAAHVPRSLDITTMNEAAQALVGERDFSAFVPVQQQGSRRRIMLRAGCARDGHLATIDLEATGFMRQMVRSIAGTLIRVGLGKLSVEGFRAILESGNRHQAATTAPAAGLYLAEVRYPQTPPLDQLHAVAAEPGPMEETR